MVVSLGNIFRYHLGSLAFGSFALMLCTVARVVFEYVERHTKAWLMKVLGVFYILYVICSS